MKLAEKVAESYKTHGFLGVLKKINKRSTEGLKVILMPNRYESLAHFRLSITEMLKGLEEVKSTPRDLTI